MNCLCSQTIKFTFDEISDNKIKSYNLVQRNTPKIQVYRIQFGVTSDRRSMETELANFKRSFDIKTDWHQDGPYYYLKAGNYTSKLSSFKDLKLIRARYPGAIYLVETVNKKLLLD